MKDLIRGQDKPDSEVKFIDCVLRIIQEWDDNDEGLCDRICLHGEYDEEISLEDIQEGFPRVRLVIAEDLLDGDIYGYDPYEGWTRRGRTVGIA